MSYITVLYFGHYRNISVIFQQDSCYISL